MSTELTDLAQAGHPIEEIPVPLNYDIIRLFSEGLYRSPHKAIEELVTNGYDAGAKRVHVLLPDLSEDSQLTAPLWVIDDGHGMNAAGFRQLWRVAESNKDNIPLPPNGRAPIGQFGIGKLASYVLAWKLTHLSRVDDTLLLTTMDFRRVTGRQNDTVTPVGLSLRKIDEDAAKTHLAEIRLRDPLAWEFMFDGQQRSPTWTAAALTDFKDLYRRLSAGRLRWILSTGLPLHTDFRISLDGTAVKSRKETLSEITNVEFADRLPGIGPTAGSARIYERPLTTGKSEQLGRSNGFFVLVRGRVINLDDELFGIQQPNHAAWARFALVVDADGLRDYLLSSREGVRDSQYIQQFRDYLLRIFNRCRQAYDDWNRRELETIDLAALLSDSPSAHVTEPLVHVVRSLIESGSEPFYIETPLEGVEQQPSDWLVAFENQASETPFASTRFVHHGIHAPALSYDPIHQCLFVNSDHPYVDKLTAGDKHRNPAKLFASSEVLLEGLLHEHGIDRATIAHLLRSRDRVLRVTAGHAPPTTSEALRLLDIANQDFDTLERATGAVFQLLGFDYERKGGNTEGPDGILYARLGLHKDTLADYRLVYDAKQTNQPSVPADKVNFGSLEDFRRQVDAEFGFFIATAYQAESDDCGKLNRQFANDAHQRLTLLKVEHLRRLLDLHCRHGLTLTKLRALFEKARTVQNVHDWLVTLESELQEEGDLPVALLLDGLEREKRDPKATPNVIAVRAKTDELARFEPERLIARLKAVESLVGTRWIEVDNAGTVLMHHTAEQITLALERSLLELNDDTIEEYPHSS